MKKTLNIGCGDRTFNEYPKGYKCLNYDERTLGGVDVVGDAKVLPFANEEFDYILASDIIEHFPLKDTIKVLTEWKRVLKLNGIIEFRLPNLTAICKKYIMGEIDAKMASWLLYGGQDYPGNFHYVGFDRSFFKSIVEPLGLIETSYIADNNNFMTMYRKDR